MQIFARFEELCWEGLHKSLRRGHFCQKCFSGSLSSWVVEWTLEDTRALLESLDGKKFTVQLDDQSIETVKGIHSEFFTNEKKLIEEAQEKMEKMLSQHREKRKRIKDGESVWLSFKAWIWAIIIVFLFLLFFLGLGYLDARSKLI